MRIVEIVAILSIAAQPAVAQQSEPGPRQTVYYRVPELRSLMEWVTFYQSFDHEDLVPDMAAGDWKLRVFGSPKLAPGLVGRALVAGTGGVAYPRARNWTVETRGAISFWVCPVKWNHDNAAITNFVLSGGSALYVERQGPLRWPDGRWRRHELLLFGLQRGPRGNVAWDCTHWKDGEWHLVVINWSWPRIEMSVDGGAFRTRELPHRPRAKLFGDLVLGSRGGDRTLLDEVFCYRRPLSRTEAKHIFDAFARTAKRRTKR